MGYWKEYLATGVKVDAGGKALPRKELRNLSEKETYLYIEGLKKFQAEPVDEDHPLSYFQIAGIHGLPHQTWPAQTWNTDIPQATKNAGFCTHTSILFLTWHRPYLALFESALYKHVNDVAKNITADDKAEYLAAAKAFRMPYWDWARKNESSVAPRAALSNDFKFPGPPSKSDQYNPLYKSPLRGVTKDIAFAGDWTVRYPNSSDDDPVAKALNKFYSTPSQDRALNSPLDPERNLTERVAYILLAYKRFGPMSSNAWRTDDPNDKTSQAASWGSLEDIHNAVHNLTGGGGHMSSIQISAFDPIFWLHHTNIDRLFAIWQALNEDEGTENTFVTNEKSQRPTWAFGRDHDDTAETELYPFRDTESTWYTSNKVKKVEGFGYTYPEIDGMPYPRVQKARDALIKDIEDKYTPLAKMIRLSKKGVNTAGVELLPQAHILKKISDNDLVANATETLSLAPQVSEIEALVEESFSMPYLKELAPENEYLEWIVNIKAEKHSLGGDYVVHVFLDAVQEDNPLNWTLSPNHVGTFAPLGQDQDTGCGKCQQDQAAHTQITGQIPLTLALAERYFAGIVGDLSKESIVPYLTKNLHWRVSKIDGTIVENRNDVAGLTVFVVSNKVTLPEDETQPAVYADDIVVHPEITTKANGTDGRGEGTGLSVGEVFI